MFYLENLKMPTSCKMASTNQFSVRCFFVNHVQKEGDQGISTMGNICRQIGNSVGVCFIEAMSNDWNIKNLDTYVYTSHFLAHVDNVGDGLCEFCPTSYSLDVYFEFSEDYVYIKSAILFLSNLSPKISQFKFLFPAPPAFQLNLLSLLFLVVMFIVIWSNWDFNL